MELNWSTFVLEIINFLVLIWILKRFLYKPVLGVIARRRAEIEKTMTDAEALQANAEKMKQQFEGRLAKWDQERQQARDALAREIDAERARKMEELQTALEQEREKARVAETRRKTDALHKMEETALAQGARFATRLLEQAAGAETETRLVEMVITELSRLPSERITALRNSYGKAAETIDVVSAFPLADDQRDRLEQALSSIADRNTPVRFDQNNDLLAGVRITVGTWILGANLRDELKGFAALAHGD